MWQNDMVRRRKEREKEKEFPRDWLISFHDERVELAARGR
jgi:hypothetical protein